MKHLQLFENHNDIDMEGFYTLHGETVLVKYKEMFGDERRVCYINKDKDINYYIASDKEVQEDFKETDDSFNIEPPKQSGSKPSSRSLNNRDRKGMSSNKKFNVVWIVANKTKETLAWNLDLTTASKVRNKNKSLPQYRKSGTIRIVPN